MIYLARYPTQKNFILNSSGCLDCWDLHLTRASEDSNYVRVRVLKTRLLDHRVESGFDRKTTVLMKVTEKLEITIRNETIRNETEQVTNYLGTRTNKDITDSSRSYFLRILYINGNWRKSAPSWMFSIALQWPIRRSPSV